MIEVRTVVKHEEGAPLHGLTVARAGPRTWPGHSWFVLAPSSVRLLPV